MIDKKITRNNCKPVYVLSLKWLGGFIKNHELPHIVSMIASENCRYPELI